MLGLGKLSSLVILSLFVNASCKTKKISGLLELTDRDYETSALQKWPRRLVMFYVPWCDNCQKLKPIWENLAQRVSKDKKLKNKIQIARINCQDYDSTCRDMNLMSYPTILLFPKSPVELERLLYKGKRDEKTLFKWLSKVVDYESFEDLAASPYISPRHTTLLDGPEGTSPLAEHLSRVKSQHFFVLFSKELKMSLVWEKMALDYMADREVAQFLFVDCKHPKKGDFYCKKYGPANDQVYTMQWFQGDSHIISYKGPPLLFDIRYFLEVVTSPDSLNMKGKLNNEAKKILKERYESKDSNFHEGILDLTIYDFQHFVSNGKALVFFYIPWCKYSQDFSTTFTIAALHFLDDADVSFARVNCMEQAELCSTLQLSSWPSITWYHNGKSLPYNSKERHLDSITKFVRKMSKADEEEFKSEQEKLFESAINKIKESQIDNIPSLTEKNINEFVQTEAKHYSFLLFHSPFCEHCKKMLPQWASFGASHLDDSVEEDGYVVKVGQVDCFQWTAMCNDKFKIERFPEFILFGPGGTELAKFEGKRTVEGWDKFISETLGDGTTKPKKQKKPKKPESPMEKVVWDEQRMKEVREKIDENMAKRKVKDEL